MLKQGWMLKTQDFSEFSELQGGRSCAGARVAPAEKFGLGRNFKPEHTLFCRELRFVAIYALFLEIFGHKKCLFG